MQGSISQMRPANSDVKQGVQSTIQFWAPQIRLFDDGCYFWPLLHSGVKGRVAFKSRGILVRSVYVGDTIEMS